MSLRYLLTSHYQVVSSEGMCSNKKLPTSNICLKSWNKCMRVTTNIPYSRLIYLGCLHVNLWPMQDTEEDPTSRLKNLPMKRSTHLLDELHSRGQLHELPNITDDDNDGVPESCGDCTKNRLEGTRMLCVFQHASE